MKAHSTIIHVPVIITADSEQALRGVVRELKASGTTFSQDDGSFKIITNGVKVKDVLSQLDRVQNSRRSSQEDEAIFASASKRRRS